MKPRKYYKLTVQLNDADEKRLWMKRARNMTHARDLFFCEHPRGIIHKIE